MKAKSLTNGQVYDLALEEYPALRARIGASKAADRGASKAFLKTMRMRNALASALIASFRPAFKCSDAEYGLAFAQDTKAQKAARESGVPVDTRIDAAYIIGMERVFYAPMRGKE